VVDKYNIGSTIDIDDLESQPDTVQVAQCSKELWLIARKG
jgi:hypothetical protein